MLNSEQILAAQKSNVEILLSLSTKAFDGFEKLVELNVLTVKAVVSEALDTSRAVLSVKDSQQLLTVQASFLQPFAEKAAAYSRHVYEIAAMTNAEMTKVAEATAAEAQAKFLAAVDAAAKNAPAGTENVVELMKSAVAGATNAYDGIQKAAKQAAGIAEANLQALSTTAVRAA